MKIDLDDIYTALFLVLCLAIPILIVVFGFMYPEIFVLILFVLFVLSTIWGAYLMLVRGCAFEYWAYIDEKSKIISKKVNCFIKPKRIAFYLKLISIIIILITVLISLVILPIIVFSIIITLLSSLIPDVLLEIIAGIFACLVFYGMGFILIYTHYYFEKYFKIKMNCPEYLNNYKGLNKIKRIKKFSED